MTLMRAFTLCRHRQLRDRCRLVQRLSGCPLVAGTCSSAVPTGSTAGRRRSFSSSGVDENDYTVGVVYPRRTSAETLEHLTSALENLPVFPLANTVVFPGAVCPLYIFEPRYRVLVQRLLRDGAHRCFGICGSDDPGHRTVVGTVVEITHNHWNEDGSASIVTRGLCRFSASACTMATNAFGYHELPHGTAEVGASLRVQTCKPRFLTRCVRLLLVRILTAADFDR